MPKKKGIVVTKAKLLRRKDVVFTEWQRLERDKAAGKSLEVKQRDETGANKKANRRTVTSPYDEPISYLKRTIYSTVRHCWKSDALDILRECAMEALAGGKSNTANRSAPQAMENPFYFGTVLITNGDKAFKRNYRSRFPRELLYAHMHDVPPHLLIGFLYQIGASDHISRRLQNEDYESWCGKLPASDLAKKLRRDKHPLAPVPSTPPSRRKT